jgi:hypothetical protein
VSGLPRVILSDIEGSESLFEILLTAIPSPVGARRSFGPRSLD